MPLRGSRHSNEQDGAAFSSSIADEVIGLFQFLYGLLQVNDVNTISLAVDVLGHFRVPATGLMTEVYASFKKLFHGYYRHVFSS